MSEQYRQRIIREKLARMEEGPAVQTIPTGFAALDRALGVGGLPRHSIVELYGPSSSGKTTLAAQIAAAAQRSGNAAWIDADHSFDPGYASSLGIDVARLPVLQPVSAEDALEIARRLCESGGLDLLVIDSAAALVPELELASGLGSAGPGLHARVLASGLHPVRRAAARSGACVLFLNQTRARRDSTGEDNETTAGGAALRLYSSARIAICPVAPGRVVLRVLKNKAATAFRTGELAWRDGAGFVETP